MNTVKAGKSIFGIAAIALGLGLTATAANPAEAQAEFKCPAEAFISPCLDAGEPGGDKLRAYWNNNWQWRYFIFMWQRPGGDLHWHELSGNSRQFTINKAWRDTTYTFKIQGCEGILMPDRCSELMILDYTTLDHYPPVPFGDDVVLNPVPG